MYFILFSNAWQFKVIKLYFTYFKYILNIINMFWYVLKKIMHEIVKSIMDHSIYKFRI